MTKPTHGPCPSYYPAEVEAFGISLYRFRDEDENGDEVFVYNAAIDLELSTNEGKHLIPIITQIYDNCPHCALRHAVMVAMEITDTFYPDVNVMDENGELVDKDDERLNIHFILNELEEEDDMPDIADIPTSRTLH